MLRSTLDGGGWEHMLEGAAQHVSVQRVTDRETYYEVVVVY